MSKSILVIDTPEQLCQKCKLCYEYADGFMCAGNGKEIPDGEKPDWCPLVEIPRKNNHEVLPDGNPMKAWGNGYNAFIDEILKEVFENPIPYNGDNIGGKD